MSWAAGCEHSPPCTWNIQGRKLVKGHKAQNCNIYPSVSLLPHTASYLPPQNISSSTTFKKFHIFQVYLHTGFCIVLLCLSIQKWQLYKEPRHAQLDATRGTKLKSFTELPKRIRMIFLPSFYKHLQ